MRKVKKSHNYRRVNNSKDSSGPNNSNKIGRTSRKA